jgi:hypothetical protein
MEDLVKRNNDRLKLLNDLEEALERFNALEAYLNIDTSEDRAELRMVMMRIQKWRGVGEH